MNLDGEDKLLVSRARDALEISEKRFMVKSVGFLNLHQKRLIEQCVPAPPDMETEFYGGYVEAERTLFLCHPQYCEPCYGDLVTVFEITGRELDDLSHRDYLGSVLSLGIVRENIGDILCLDGRTYLYVRTEIAEYIEQNLKKIGNRGVRLKRCELGEVQIPEKETREVSGTVASLRLDSVLSLALGLARGKTAELIRSGRVSLNWEPTESVSAELKAGDMISVRGFGRIKLARVGGLSRKGRLGISVERYI